MYKFLVTTIFCFFIFFKCAYSVDIGSDTAVNRFNSQVILNDGDRIAGFAGVETGFILSSAAVSASFDSVFPVSGPVDLNSGTLVLNQDLRFDNQAELFSLGHVVGNGYLFDLSPTISCIVTDKNADDRACNVGFLFSQSLLSVVVAGDWSYDDKYVAIGTFGVGGDEVSVYNFTEQGATLEESQDTNNTTVYSLRWHPNKYRFAVGTSTASGSLPELRIFDFDPSGPTLTQVDSVNIGSLCTSVAWHPTGDYLAVGTFNSSTEIILYSVSSVGTLTQEQIINLSPNRLVYLQTMDWDATAKFLSVGTSVSGSNPNFLIYEFDDSIPNLTLQASQATSRLIWATSWNKTYTDVIAVTYQGSGDLIEIFEHNVTGATANDRLVKKSGITDSSVVYSCHWNPNGNCLAIGKNATGGSTEFRVYGFDSNTFALNEVSAFESNNYVIDLQWSHNGQYILTGGNGSNVNFYKNSFTDCFTFWQTDWLLNANLTLKDTCLLFSGNSSINGQGNKLILQGSSEIRIDEAASLLLKDITIEGVKNQNISCLDNSSTLSLQFATWLLDGDYSFSVGHFDVAKDFLIDGNGYTFSYQTGLASTVSPNSSFVLSNNLTFYYDPSANSSDLLFLTDKTAQIFLSNMTLHSTKTGLRFTKGTVVIDDAVYFKSDSSVQAEGIMFGDGISSSNNVTVKWLSESGIQVDTGFLIYQNV